MEYLCKDDDESPVGLPYADADLDYMEQVEEHDRLQENYGITTPEPTLTYPEEGVYGK